MIHKAVYRTAQGTLGLLKKQIFIVSMGQTYRNSRLLWKQLNRGGGGLFPLIPPCYCSFEVNFWIRGPFFIFSFAVEEGCRGGGGEGG